MSHIHRTFAVGALLLGGWLFAPNSAEGARYRYGYGARGYYAGHGYYNPYAAGYVHQGTYYNPYRGRVYNRGVYYNPYTGRYSGYRSTYSPYTGTYRYRYYNR